MKRILRYVILAIGLMMVAAGCVTEKDEPEWFLQPGDTLPQFEVVTLDGTTISSADSYKADMVIVFFNTTCPDCRREFPELQKLYEANQMLPEGERDIYICIAREEGAEAIERYWTENDLTLPVSPQPDRRIYSLFASIGIPRIFYARDGKIIAERLRPTIYGIKVGGIEAEKTDAYSFCVRLPYGTACTSLSCDISANSEVSTDGIPDPKVIDLSNPVTMKAVMGNDTVCYSLIARYSDLPIVYVNTPAPILSKDNWVKKCTVRIANAGEYNSLYQDVQMKGRGNSTWGFPKKPYAIKLDKKSEVLGMPRHKRWCLLANWIDRTNIRNEIALEAARRLSGLAWTPRGRFVEVVFNGEFAGNYYLCEQIKVDPARVDIDEMTEGDVSGEALTGGYLLELDSNFDEVNRFRSKGLNLPVNFKDPDEDVLGPQQFGYMEDYFNDVESRLIEHADYSEIERLMDVGSFIDWWFVHELTGNWEPNHPKSSYMHKPRNGKLTAGPVWDFDWGTFRKPDAWYIYNSIWYPYLFSYPEFFARVRERWREIKPSMLTMPDYIQTVSDMVKASAEYDYTMWPIDRVVNEDEGLSYEESVERIKRYWIDRVNWIDGNLHTINDD